LKTNKKEIIIIFTQNKFDSRDYIRFGVDKIILAGYELEVYDLSPILRPKDYNDFYIPQNEIKDSYVIRIHSIQHLEQSLKRNQESIRVIFCFFHLYPFTEAVFNVLSRLNISYVVFKLGALPNINSIWRKLLSRLYYNFKYKVIKNHLNSAKYYVVAGKKAMFETGVKRNRNTKVLQTASFDFNAYECFVKEVKIKNCSSNEIIFIDEYYPLHPDLDGEIFINPKYYFQKVNEFLEKLSIELNMTCSIAVHPRADYRVNPYSFPLIHQKTIESIYNSKFIVGHASTAFSFAVLMNKPILQIGFMEVKKHYYGRILSEFAKELGLQTCYIDNNFEWSYPEINKEKYKKFICNYLHNNGPDNFKDPIDAILIQLSRDNISK
jgi:hypothetical protein